METSECVFFTKKLKLSHFLDVVRRYTSTDLSTSEEDVALVMFVKVEESLPLGQPSLRSEDQCSQGSLASPLQSVLREPAVHHVHLHGGERRTAAQPCHGALRGQLHLQEDPRLRLLLPGESLTRGALPDRLVTTTSKYQSAEGQNFLNMRV